LLQEARSLDRVAAAARLRTALALWRGPALADFAYDDFARSEIDRLEELRESCIERRIDIELALGHHDDLVPELESLVHEYPLRERLRHHLILALYRSGRQGDALQAYQDARTVLREQLGLDPGDDLQELQTIQLKMRHKPFGLYMKWLEGGDVGRQVLFSEGQYDDQVQVKLGGKLSKVLPTLKLDPTGSMAMKESRHPVTEMGLLQLAELVLQYRRRDLLHPQGVHWEMIPDQKFLDHVCDCWVVEYDNREVEKVYRKSITYIDRKYSLPICVKNFGWPAEGGDFADVAALDEATFIEYYGYTDIEIETRLSDADFDKGNADYKFRR